MRYLMFITHPERYREETIPDALLAAMDAFVAEASRSGIVRDTAGLMSSAHGFQIRTGGGQLTVTDGPFSEAKEVVGGYAMVETDRREEAFDLARRFMELHRVHWPAFEGACEVRPLEE